MNELLPRKEDLFPILADRQTFYDSGFHEDFSKLSFDKKLEIINDIIRQTMIFNPTPDPSCEVEQMIGDSYTASKIAIAYLKYFNLGTNYKLVFARQKVFEPEDVQTMHVLILVDSPDHVTYQFDCTPFVGYKNGKVAKLENDNFYKNYVVIEGNLQELLEKIRESIYELSHMDYVIHTKKYDEIIHESEKYDILNGFVSYLCSIIAIKTTDLFTRERYIKYSQKRNPYQRDMDGSYENKWNNEMRKLACDQIKCWKEELNDLVCSDRDYKRQLELAQSITQIFNQFYPSNEKALIVHGEKIPYSQLTPRIFLEHGYNVVLIKPSSFKLGVEASVKNQFLKRGNGIITEYDLNLGIPTSLGLKPMRLFHPHGYKYERSMTGPAHLLLVQRKAEEILKIKHEIRNSLGTKIFDHEVMWFDEKPIVWNPVITNLVHTTDDPSEACMHFLSMYPEYQLMTRFMYPNPILSKKEKYERIRI